MQRYPVGRPVRSMNAQRPKHAMKPYSENLYGNVCPNLWCSTCMSVSCLRDSLVYTPGWYCLYPGGDTVIMCCQPPIVWRSSHFFISREIKHKKETTKLWPEPNKVRRRVPVVKFRRKHWWRNTLSKNMVLSGFVEVSRNQGGSDLGPSRYDKFGGIRSPLNFWFVKSLSNVL